MNADDRKLGRGTAWVGIASGLSGVLDVVTTVTVLRLGLSTADLGIATLAGAMLPVLERLSGVGMPFAMVRQADGDRRALSTMQWIAVAGSLIVLAALFALGRPIGEIFDAPIIGDLLVGYGAKLVIQNIQFVPEALMRRELRFETLTKVRIVASVCDAATKLVLALIGMRGYPELRIWCFVLGPIVNGVVVAVGIQLCHPWRPQLVFDRRVAASALRYGTQVSAGELLYYVYTNADYLVIGRVWGGAAVGAYRLAYELVLDVVKLISQVTAEVAFPAFARTSEPARAGELLIRFTRQNAITLVPVVAFLGVAADDLLAALYGRTPDAAATAARILCAVGALRVISFVLPAVLAGLGHARDSLGYHVLAAVLLPAAFAGAAWIAPGHGYVVVAWAWAVAYPIAFALLLGRALARCQVTLVAYLRRLIGIVACGGIATALGIAVHAALPDGYPVPRLFAVALVILVSFALALARIERITPRSILRTLRGQDAPGPPTTGPG